VAEKKWSGHALLIAYLECGRKRYFFWSGCVRLPIIQSDSYVPGMLEKSDYLDLALHAFSATALIDWKL